MIPDFSLVDLQVRLSEAEDKLNLLILSEAETSELEEEIHDLETEIYILTHG